MRKVKINYMMVVLTFIAGLIAFAVDEVILAYLYKKIDNTILMGMYFGVVVLLLCFAVLLAERIKGLVNGIIWKQRYVKDSIKIIPLVFIAVFLVSILLQYIYEMGFKGNTSTNDIVFVIDCSASMSESDPQFERYSAAKGIINKMTEDNRVAVVDFNDEADILVSLQTLNEEAKNKIADIINNTQKATGGTRIKNALDVVLKHISDTEQEQRTTKVILLSDGEDNNSELSAISARKNIISYIKKGIEIDTISLINSSGVRLMKRLSRLTGGNSLFISNVEQLKVAYNELYVSEGERLLVDARYGSGSMRLMCEILRIMFITFIGVMISVGIAVILDNRNIFRLFLLKGIVCSFLAGFVLEYGFSSGFFCSYVLRFIAVMLLSIMFTFYSVQGMADYNPEKRAEDFTSDSIIDIDGKISGRVNKYHAKKTLSKH